jgi:hypothetical protein
MAALGIEPNPDGTYPDISAIGGSTPSTPSSVPSTAAMNALVKNVLQSHQAAQSQGKELCYLY